MLPEELLEVLACPACKGELSYQEEKEVLVCEKCGVFYEVREGIPVLLPDSGKPLSELS
ncbi:MAG: Trm112 family protein [Aquificae bacterium]|nr:Trm112 family protein [Aquificota bacterium]